MCYKYCLVKIHVKLKGMKTRSDVRRMEINDSGKDADVEFSGLCCSHGYGCHSNFTQSAKWLWVLQ